MTLLTKFDLKFPDYMYNDETIKKFPRFKELTKTTSDDYKYEGLPIFNLGFLAYDHIPNLHRNVRVPIFGPQLNAPKFLVPQYGVADTLEQIIELYGEILDLSPRNFIIDANIILKKDEPLVNGCGYGGWRWHKNGPYVGNKEPQYEYLAEEDDSITQAVTFALYEIDANKTSCTNCIFG